MQTGIYLFWIFRQFSTAKCTAKIFAHKYLQVGIYVCLNVELISYLHVIGQTHAIPHNKKTKQYITRP